MPICTIAVGITNNKMLLSLLEFFNTPEDIIGVLDGTPCLDEKNGIYLSLIGSGMGPKIVDALCHEREDLIIKHKIEFYGIKPLLESVTKDDDCVEKMKKFIDVIAAHYADPEDAQLLRWIPAKINNSMSIIAKKLADYCFEKGYHTGVSDGLINAIDTDGTVWNRSYYEKYLDAGADPTAKHTASGRDNAISAAFKKKDMDAIRLFAERGYDLSAEIAKIPRAERHLFSFFPVKKMINGIHYTLSNDKKNAVAVQLTEGGFVTTQLTVVTLEDRKYMFINPVNRTVFGEQIPVSEFTE